MGKVEYVETEEDLDMKNFNNFVLDFTASWCGPCKEISPEFERLSEMKPLQHVKFYKVDVDQSETLCAQFKVQSMPTFYLIKNRVVVDRVLGANITELVDKIKKHFLK